MKRGGTVSGSADDGSWGFLEQLVRDVNLSAGKIQIALHDDKVSVVTVKATFKVTFDGSGRITTKSQTVSLFLAAAERVQDGRFLGHLRDEVGSFGSCVARVARGQVSHWEFRRRRKPSHKDVPSQ